jgi:hypothetical protein
MMAHKPDERKLLMNITLLNADDAWCLCCTGLRTTSGRRAEHKRKRERTGVSVCFCARDSLRTFWNGFVYKRFCFRLLSLLSVSILVWGGGGGSHLGKCFSGFAWVPLRTCRLVAFVFLPFGLRFLASIFVTRFVNPQPRTPLVDPRFTLLRGRNS